MNIRGAINRGMDYWEIPAFLALAFAVGVLAFYVHGLGQTLPEVVGGKGDVIVPSTGVEGFPVAEFCQDDLTEVQAFPAPDSSGVSYQLVRTKDGVTETVVVVLNAADEVSAATHYHDTPTGQVARPAFVDDDARECIEEKALR